MFLVRYGDGGAKPVQFGCIFPKEAVLEQKPMRLPRGLSIFDQDGVGARVRDTLSASGIGGAIRRRFQDIEDGREPSQIKVPLVDALMSGFAVFALKMPSLLHLDAIRADESRAHNLRKLFGIKKLPSDTAIREILDEVDPQTIRGAFTTVFSLLQRGKALEQFVFHDGKYLISLDGTGHFSSDTVFCSSCLVKHSKKDGTKTYHHQTLAAVLIHPDLKVVIPLCPEPIIKQDGDTKNDCERNAGKRIIEHIRREHPRLPIIVVEDGLASNAPHIAELRKNGMSFILGAKPGDHKAMFAYVEQQATVGKVQEIKERDGNKFRIYRFINGVPLNAKNSEVLVNLLEVFESEGETSRRKAKGTTFSWVTDITITSENVKKLAHGGRARWKIENETFNTLKNQGYEFEHNFGHGYRHLSVVFTFLMMLAFLVDQAQLLCCKLFQAAKIKMIRASELWDKLRSLFREYLFESYEEMLGAIAYGLNAPRPAFRIPDSS